MRDVMRLKHYSLRTERSYCDWVKRLIRFHRLRHPRDMGEEEVGAFAHSFLTRSLAAGQPSLLILTTGQNVAASTQNQALSAVTLPL